MVPQTTLGMSKAERIVLGVRVSYARIDYTKDLDACHVSLLLGSVHGANGEDESANMASCPPFAAKSIMGYRQGM